MATTTLTCCCLLSHNVLIALSVLCSHLDGSACSFPISHQCAVSASWSLCRSTSKGHSTQEAFRLENVICGMTLPFHFTQLCHQNEIPRNGIILPEGSLYARYRAPRSGQCIQKQPVFPARLFPGVFCPAEMKRVLSFLAFFAQWCSNESCALCQRLCLLRSSKMQRKINDAGKVPAMP